MQGGWSPPPPLAAPHRQPSYDRRPMLTQVITHDGDGGGGGDGGDDGTIGDHDDNGDVLEPCARRTVRPIKCHWPTHPLALIAAR